MCGRYTLRTPWPALVEQFQLSSDFDYDPRYNIAPTQQVAAIRSPASQRSRAANDEASDGRELAFFHWGLIPSWAKDPSVGNRMINARGETVHEKPSFQAAFKRRRCLVLADGYYEWKKLGRRKQPYYIRMKGERPFAFAGLWESWEGKNGADGPAEKIESCTIITTDANELTADIHDRMPVIVAADDYDAWLTADEEDLDPLKAIIHPFDSDALRADPVSTRVNSPQNDDEECVKLVRGELF